jgi:predicted transcriptional regulator
MTAREMRRRHTGAVIVVEPWGEGVAAGRNRTDRDIVCGQLARGADMFCLTVGDVMTRNPLTVAATSSLSETVERLSARGVRRAPVVNVAGDLVGIISLDDLRLMHARTPLTARPVVGHGAAPFAGR